MSVPRAVAVAAAVDAAAADEDESEHAPLTQVQGAKLLSSTADTVSQGSASMHWKQYACGWLAKGHRLIWDSGLTCSFLSSLIFSFSALFVKLTAGRVPVLEVCLVRSSVSLGLSLVLMYLSGLPPRRFFGSQHNMWLLFLRGCCGACGMTASYVALFMLPLGDAVTIKLIGPPMTATFACLLLKEPMGYRGAVGCCIALSGVVLVTRPPFLFGAAGWTTTRALGIVAGLTAAVFGSCSSMTIRLIGGSEPAAVVAVWFHAATLLLSVFPLLLGVPNKPVLLSPHDGGLLLGVAATSSLAQLLSTRGLQRCQAAKAAAMGFTQVVYSHVLGYLIFKDQLTLGSFLGALLILFGVLLVTMRSAASTPEGLPAATPAAGPAVCKAPSSDATAPAGAPIGAGLKQLRNDSNSNPNACVAALELSCVQPPAAADSTQAEGNTASAVRQGSSMAEGQQQQQHQQQQQIQDEASPTPRGYLHLLSLVAASTAAALGGELCPAESTAVSLVVSRRVSTELAGTCSSTAQLSRQVSKQWSISRGTPRFLNSTVIGLECLPDVQLLAAVAVQQQQQEEEALCAGMSAKKDGGADRTVKQQALL